MSYTDFKKGCELWTRDELIESLYNITKEIEELKNRIHDLLIDDTEYKLENARLKKKYENAVSDYELEHYKVVKAIEYINKTTNNTMFELRSDTGELNYLMRILKGE